MNIHKSQVFNVGSYKEYKVVTHPRKTNIVFSTWNPSHNKSTHRLSERKVNLSYLPSS